MLTEWDKAVEAVLDRERGVRILVGLCGDESEEVRHRGVVCLANLVNAPGNVGEKAKEILEKEGAIEAVAECVKASKVREVVEVGVQVLTVLTQGK